MKETIFYESSCLNDMTPVSINNSGLVFIVEVKQGLHTFCSLTDPFKQFKPLGSYAQVLDALWEAHKGEKGDTCVLDRLHECIF